MRIHHAAAVILAVPAILILAASVMSEDSYGTVAGDCGDEVFWSLQDDGLLEIWGSGAMYDFDGTPPWSHYGIEVKSVVIMNGVTSIGNSSFYRHSHLASVSIAPTVRSIGAYAFSGCTGLASADIPSGVWHIGNGAFSGCIGMSSVTMHDTLLSIGEGAFRGCDSLYNVVLPDSLNVVGAYAFSGCENLHEVTVGMRTVSVEEGAFSYCTHLVSVTNRSALDIVAGDDGYGGIAAYAVSVTGTVNRGSDGNVEFMYNTTTNAVMVTKVSGTTEYLNLDTIQTPLGNGTVTGIRPDAVGSGNELAGIFTGDGFGYMPEGFFANTKYIELTIGPSLWYISQKDIPYLRISSLSVSSSNEHFSEYGQSLYSRDGTVLIRGCFHDDGSTLVIRDGTAGLGPGALDGCYCESVSLPSSFKGASVIETLWCMFTISEENAKSLSSGRYTVSATYMYDVPENIKALADGGDTIFLEIISDSETVEPVPVVLRVDDSVITEYSSVRAIGTDGSYRTLDTEYRNGPDGPTVSFTVDGTSYIAFVLTNEPFFKHPWIVAAAIAGCGTLVAAVQIYRRHGGPA